MLATTLRSLSLCRLRHSYHDSSRGCFPETKLSFLGKILSKSAVSLFTPAKYLSSSRFAIGIWADLYHFIPEWSEPNVFVHHQARENLSLSLYRYRNYKYLSCWQCKELFHIVARVLSGASTAFGTCIGWGSCDDQSAWRFCAMVTVKHFL